MKVYLKPPQEMHGRVLKRWYRYVENKKNLRSDWFNRPRVVVEDQLVLNEIFNRLSHPAFNLLGVWKKR